MTEHFRWTQDRIEQASALWATRHTMDDIGKHLGATRNSVATMIYRRRHLFPKLDKEQKRVRKSVIKVEQVQEVVKTRAKAQRNPARKLERKAPTKKSVTWAMQPTKPFVRAESSDYKNLDLAKNALPGVKPVHFVDLRHNQCRYPLQRVSDVAGPSTPCCGAQVSGKGYYCAPHRMRMYAVS